MRVVLAGLCGVAVLLGACNPGDGVRITTSRSGERSSERKAEGQGPLKVVDALQCPQTVGPLTRKGTAQDEGSWCLYVGPRGAEAKLHLVRLDGRPVEAVLDRYEAGLRRGLAWADAEAAESNRETVRVEAEGERASVRAPGVRIETDGDVAQVRVGPFSIRSSRKKDGAPADPPSEGAAQVEVSQAEASQAESVSVRASAGRTEVRVREGGDGVRALWRLSRGRGDGEGDWRMVGYQARGPVGGPLVIVTVRSRDAESDPIFDAVDELLRLNVGD